MWHAVFFFVKSILIVAAFAAIFSAIACVCTWLAAKFSGKRGYGYGFLDILIESFDGFFGMTGAEHRWAELLFLLSIFGAALSFSNMVSSNQPALLPQAISQAVQPIAESNVFKETMDGISSIFEGGTSSPVVGTLPASSITASSVVLNGTVYPAGFQGVAAFAYGTDETLDGKNVSRSPYLTIEPGEKTQSLSFALNGLKANNVYYYKLVFYGGPRNESGSILSVRTLSAPGFEWEWFAILCGLLSIAIFIDIVRKNTVKEWEEKWAAIKQAHDDKHEKKVTEWNEKVQQLEDAAKNQQQQKGKKGQQPQQQPTPPPPPAPVRTPWYKNNELLLAFGADIIAGIVEHYFETRKGLRKDVTS